MDAVTRTFDAIIEDVNAEKRSVVARINTSNVDRYNTVILARGGSIGHWQRAGAPVLWEHGKDPRNFTDPIANSPKLWNNGGPNPTELIAEPVFRNNAFSQERFEMYRSGAVRGWSVNIVPKMKSVGPPTHEELRARPDWEGAELIYRQWELSEFSGTVIPGNADALTSDRAAKVMEMVQRGSVWLPEEVRPIYEAALHRTMTESVGGQQGGGGLVKHEAEGREAPYVDTDGQTWMVRDRDGSELIAFPDAGMAERCLRAMGEQRSFGAVHSEAILSDRAFYDELKKDVVALLNLELLGRV